MTANAKGEMTLQRWSLEEAA